MNKTLENELVALHRKYQRGGLTIDWFVGKRCNYDCSYCTPDIHDNTSPHIPLEDLKRSITVFLERFGGKDIKIGFTGGEPCVHPEFHTFCQYMHENGIFNTTVTTNGTRTAEYYIDLFKYIKSMTISQHFEYANDQAFLDKVKEITTNNNGKWVMVQVMFHADYFEEAKRSVEFYKEHNINYSLRRIRPKGFSNKYSLDYSEEMLQWFFDNQPPEGLVQPNVEVFYKESPDGEVKSEEMHVNEISGAQINDFSGWTCWAGLEHLHVWWDGRVYRGNCHVDGVIGNVMDTDFKLPSNPVVCDVTRCFCAPEITIKKVKSMDYINHVQV